ncbi:MAG: hypothetical protein ACTFAL_12805 [Candidatus Electronema sp. V4]|uniref:hypothetical protein n=1 Tax=Candidatus Electronema sp. V4 TaxID=3454756 RepID=UPI0040555982
MCEIELAREWFRNTAPFLKLVASTLSLVLPAASSGVKLALDDAACKAIEEQLDFGRNCLDAALKGGDKLGGWLGQEDAADDLPHGAAVRAEAAVLRELHVLLKAKAPGFGGLKKVLNNSSGCMSGSPESIDGGLKFN